MSEKLLPLVSGGIDSPLACVLLSREFEVLPLYYCLFPMATKESSMKAIETLNNLKKATGFEKAIIYPWSGMLREIKRKINDRYSCVACRRAMVECASDICKEKGAFGIVTGESLGQKASQTMENISATSSDTSIPIIRPLIGLNKDEIVKMSRDLGILKEEHSGCCQAVPSTPATKAGIKDLDREMKKIDYGKIKKKSDRLSLTLEQFLNNGEDYFDKLVVEFG